MLSLNNPGFISWGCGIGGSGPLRKIGKDQEKQPAHIRAAAHRMREMERTGCHTAVCNRNRWAIPNASGQRSLGEEVATFAKAFNGQMQQIMDETIFRLLRGETCKDLVCNIQTDA